jgi:hypothetical protein
MDAGMVRSDLARRSLRQGGVVVVVVVVELDPAGAAPTCPGSVRLLVVEHEKQPVAILEATTIMTK